MNFEEELNIKTSEINSIIADYLPKETKYQLRITEAANYSVNAGGKRIRPMLLMEVYKLCGGNDLNKIKAFMTALECIHTYSLVHDDLPAMDNDDYRRGMLTTHKKYGEDFGVLAGDALLNYAYELMLHDMDNTESSEDLKRAVKAADIIARKAGIYGMVGGQSLDVYLTGKPMNEDELDFIFRLKTGALIEAAFMAGATLAGADDLTVTELEKAGGLVGVAFQIQDDILDITSTQEVLGKPIRSDEKNHKTTYVTLYGFEKAKADVAEMSDKALTIIKNTGDNEFLEQLICRLINRKK
ncbi:MAG: polyprenyl synthetase family protein [Lachnospira sp.]|nr:polyprenyl synthetase family protein [Lachnospira sp.]